MSSHCQQVKEAYDQLVVLSEKFRIELEIAKQGGSITELRKKFQTFELAKESLVEKIWVYREWKTYADGERVGFCHLPFNFWCQHPKGIVVAAHNQVILIHQDGSEEFLFIGPFTDIAHNIHGVTIRSGNTFLLDGEEILYEGDPNLSPNFKYHPEGVAIRQRQIKTYRLFVNDSHFYEKMVPSSNFRNFGCVIDGLIIDDGKVARLNGKDVLYKTEGESSFAVENFEGHIFLRDKIYYFNGIPIPNFDFNPKHLKSYLNGFIQQRGDQLLLNGVQTIFKGEFDDWNPYPNGIMIRKEMEWFFYSSKKRDIQKRTI